MLSLIKELGERSRASKLDQPQREKAYGLMTTLRGYGFTIHELFVIFRGRLSEISIKRNTRGGEVKDMTEHDKVLELLTLFAEGGHGLSELEDYRRDKEMVDNAGLSFESCGKLSRNLLLLGIDAQGLVNLSDELTEENLTAKSIRANIDLNDKLAKKHLTPENQEDILKAAEKHGDSANILGMINAVGTLKEVTIEAGIKVRDLDEAKAERDRVQLETEKIEVENANFRSYIEVAKVLVTKHGFDMKSLNELLALAEKHNDASHIIGAVNAYNDMTEIQAARRDSSNKLKAVEEELAGKEYALRLKEEGFAKANQLLGEIRANHAQSIRLQILSDLIMKPREVKADVDEVAKIILIVLRGLEDYTAYRRHESERFTNQVGLHMKWFVESIQTYLR